jgi:hypothetical protein
MRRAGADATGLESVDLPMPSLPSVGKAMASRNAEVLRQAEEEFQNSDLLSILKANSEENRAKYVRQSLFVSPSVSGNGDP